MFAGKSRWYHESLSTLIEYHLKCLCLSISFASHAIRFGQSMKSNARGKAKLAHLHTHVMWRRICAARSNDKCVFLNSIWTRWNYTKWTKKKEFLFHRVLFRVIRVTDANSEFCSIKHDTIDAVQLYFHVKFQW